MSRQTRSRVALSRCDKAFSGPAPAPAPAPVPVSKLDNIDIRSDETDIYGVSDREIERQRRTKEATKNGNERPTPVGTRGTRSTRSAVATINNMDSSGLESFRQRRDVAMSKLDDLTSTTTDAADSPALELSRKHFTSDTESSLLSPRRGNLSGLANHKIEMFGSLDSSFGSDSPIDDDGRGRAFSTKSADTSTLNVSVFRRQKPVTRRRQSSVIGKDDAPIRPSSRGPATPGLSTTFSVGNFPRRERQPSILMSSAQKAGLGLQQRGLCAASSESENAVGSEVDDVSFLPEAEGTPVKARREREGTTEDAMEDIRAQGQRCTRKMRKSRESHEDKAAKRQAVEAAEETIHQSIESYEQSSSPGLSEMRRRTPEVDEAILAKPISDDEGSPIVWPSLKNLGKKIYARVPAHSRKTAGLDDEESDLSEPPSLTHSPNPKPSKTVAKENSEDSPKLSTADLEALLPRRRKKVRRDEYDMDENTGNSSDVERHTSRAIKKKRPARLSNGSPHPTEAQTKRTTRRTYGLRNFNGENTVDGDRVEVNGGGSAPHDGTASRATVNEETTATLGLPQELKAASRKFKEVDKWELDFEEVTESSSELPESW